MRPVRVRRGRDAALAVTVLAVGFSGLVAARLGGASGRRIRILLHVTAGVVFHCLDFRPKNAH